MIQITVCCSWEGNPPKKPPTQIKPVCTNSVLPTFGLFLEGKRGSLHTVSKIVCANSVFILVGGFLGVPCGRKFSHT